MSIHAGRLTISWVEADVGSLIFPCLSLLFLLPIELKCSHPQESDNSAQLLMSPSSIGNAYLWSRSNRFILWADVAGLKPRLFSTATLKSRSSPN
jgi:hypothetical protein